MINKSRLGKLQKNFKILLTKLIYNCVPNYMITRTKNKYRQKTGYGFSLIWAPLNLDKLNVHFYLVWKLKTMQHSAFHLFSRYSTRIIKYYPERYITRMCSFIVPYFVANLTLCQSTDDNFKMQMKCFFLLLNLKKQ